MFCIIIDSVIQGAPEPPHVNNRTVKNMDPKLNQL